MRPLHTSRCRQTLPKPLTDTSTPLPTLQSAIVCPLYIQLLLEVVDVSHQFRIGARRYLCLLGPCGARLGGQPLKPHGHVRQDLGLLPEFLPSNIPFPGCCVPLTGNASQFALQLFDFGPSAGNGVAVFCRLDCTITTLNVSVVSLDCFLGDISGIGVLVVQVGHHFCGDPHRPPMICVQLGTNDGHDQQCECGGHAV